MATSTIEPEEKRRVLEKLAEEGPMSHDELTKELGYDWDQMQQLIRHLRKQGLVEITIDRRYETSGSHQSASA